MKYIKMFEDKDVNYSVISGDEYADIIETPSLRFNDREFSAINKVLEAKSIFYSLDLNYGDTEVTNTSQGVHDLNRPYITIYFDIQRSANIHNDFEAVKFDDEYYYIEISNYSARKREYYKCDQFDGLLQCIKDNV